MELNNVSFRYGRGDDWLLYAVDSASAVEFTDEDIIAIYNPRIDLMFLSPASEVFARANREWLRIGFRAMIRGI
jgi:hypothetical protein